MDGKAAMKKDILKYSKNTWIGLEKLIEKSEKQVEIDRARVEGFIADKKQIPEGAGPDGIKPYRIPVPVVEEETTAPPSKSRIEQILDENTLTVDYSEPQGVHISEIVGFMSEYLDVNMVIDMRVVQPPPSPQTQQPGVAGAPAAGVPGAPGMPGMPGAGVGGVPRPGGGAAAGRGAAGPAGMMGGMGMMPGMGMGMTGVGGAQGQGAGYRGAQVVTDGMVHNFKIMNKLLRIVFYLNLLNLLIDQNKY